MKRNPKHVARDLHLWLSMLATAQALGIASTIAYCTREVRAMEMELTYCRYGRTDVI